MKFKHVSSTSQQWQMVHFESREAVYYKTIIIMNLTHILFAAHCKVLPI